MSDADQVRSKKAKGGLLSELLAVLLSADIYRRQQGRIARQVTFGAILLLVGLGAWRLGLYLRDNAGVPQSTVTAVSLALRAGGAWFGFRVVNLPNFADFLIAVEAEMNKVSWPTRTELFRSSLVVIFSILFLAGILFCYDLFWRELLDLMGVIRR